MPMFFQGAPFAGSGTSAAKPAATAVPSGTLYFASDVGENGSYLQSNGTRWRALNGAAALKTLGAQSANIAAVETIVLQASIPAGAWQTNDNLRIWTSLTKSGAVDTGNLVIRIGTAGTTADTAVANMAAILAASNVTGGFIHEFKLASATSSQKVGTQFSAPAYNGASNSAIQAPIAISDASANALFVSVSISSSGATNTVAMQSGQIQLITP